MRSFLHLTGKENVLRTAEEVDRKIERNEEVGLLAGVLVGVKDNICTADMPSTAGSRVLEGYKPPFDATAVRKVRELGGILLGKTNLDEFGMGSTTEGSAFQVMHLFVNRSLLTLGMNLACLVDHLVAQLQLCLQGSVWCHWGVTQAEV